jgi:hypothetical protein
MPHRAAVAGSVAPPHPTCDRSGRPAQRAGSQRVWRARPEVPPVTEATDVAAIVVGSCVDPKMLVTWLNRHNWFVMHALLDRWCRLTIRPPTEHGSA